MGKVLVVGSLNMDFVIDTERMPQIGETILGEKFTLVPGGKGANQAYALGKLGGNVCMLGMIGNDVYGKKLEENLQSVSVDVSKIKISSNNSTGVAFITVDKNGDNSIVVISGANLEMSKQYIDENIDLIKQCDCIVMQLEIPVEVVTYVATLAKQNEKMVILDPAPAQKTLPNDLIKNIDIIKPNETELSILTGMPTSTMQDIKYATKKLLDMGIKNVIVTLGGNGSVIATMNEFVHIPAKKVEVIDTTAAGDSFTAGLTIAILEGKSIIQAVEYATKVSSIVVTRKGAQSSIPSKQEVDSITMV